MQKSLRRSTTKKLLLIFFGAPVLLLSFQNCGSSFRFQSDALQSTENLSSLNPTLTPTPIPTVPPGTSVGKISCTLDQLNFSHHPSSIRSFDRTDTFASPEGYVYGLTVGGKVISRDFGTAQAYQFRPLLDLNTCDYQLQTEGPLLLCLEPNATGELSYQNCNSQQPAQRWNILRNKDQSFQIKNLNGKCLELEASSVSNPRVHVMDCAANRNQVLALEGLSTSALYPAPLVTETGPMQAAYQGSAIINGSQVSKSRGMSLQPIYKEYWYAPQANASLEYTLDVPLEGNYSVQVVYASWLPGTSIDVFVDGQSAGNLKLPVSGNDQFTFVETAAFPLKLKKGLTKITFSAPSVFIPYNFSYFYVQWDGEELTKIGQVTKISSTVPTEFDIAKIHRIYRFSLDNSLGVLAWRYPHNVAHLEYKIFVEKAGRYGIKLNYSSPSGQDSFDLVVNGPLRISAGYQVLGNIALPSTGATIGTFQISPEVILDLPAGESRLDFLAHSGADNSFVREMAVSGITVTPR